MPERPAITADEVRALLREPPEDVHPTEPVTAPQVSPARWAYREAVCLLGFFEAGALWQVRTHEPADAGAQESDSALKELLAGDCGRVSTRQGRRWCLRPEVRTATLERLRTPERLLRALEPVPRDPADGARAWVERFLGGSPAPTAGHRLDDLHVALTVTGWFSSAPRARAGLAERSLHLPDREELRGRIPLAELLEPLSALAGDRAFGFFGRGEERAVLADHLAARPAPDPGTGPAHRMLMVHGPGGVGKSALLARFLLEHLGTPEHRPMPFAYLSFDRTDLLPQQPLTLLVEAARQFGLLFPEVAPAAHDFAKWTRRTLLADQAATDATGPRGGRDSDEGHLVDLFASLARETARRGTWAAEDGGAPVLLVLDTLEQAQRQGPHAMANLGRLLRLLADDCPQLRIVAAGRAPLGEETGLRPEQLPLKGFGEDLALSFLREHLGPSGAEHSTEFLRSVVHRLDTNPLSLKLAAELIRQEGAHALDAVETRRRVLVRMEPEYVQGVLYHRILDHLDDPDLRRIAGPGLTVRQVTPEVISEVLAGPCGLGPVGPDRAEDLFRLLRAEASLVEDLPGGRAVVHRADVRRAMLPMLRRDDAALMDRINRRAVRYYVRLADGADAAGDPGRVAEYRAEELYHRLALGQAASTLDRRWRDDAGPLLDAALDELPPRGRVYLSDRLGLTVPPALRAIADNRTWARQAGRAAGALLRDGLAEAALSLLSERSGGEADSGALDVLRLRAMVALGLRREVRDLVEPALDRASEESPAHFVELALLGARSEEDGGDFGAARRLLRQAEVAATAVADDTVFLAVAVAAIRLHRRAGTDDGAAARATRREVLRRVPLLSRRILSRHPQLVRDLAAEVGDELPDLVSLAARLLGVDLDGVAGTLLRSSLTHRDLADFTATTSPVTPHTESPVHAVEEAEEAEDVEERDVDRPADTAPTVADPWRASNRRPDAYNTLLRGDRISSYLESNASGRQDVWNHALVEAYQYEADHPSSARSGSNPLDGPPDRAADAVVVVPGFMGSRLFDATTGRRVWGHPVHDLLRSWREEGHAALALTAEERAGVFGRIVPTGLLDTPAWSPTLGGFEPYQPLLETVRSAAAHPAAVLSFAYDWRLPVVHNAALLRKAAERHLARWSEHPAARRVAGMDSAPPRLVFIAHSMGGLVVDAALTASPELAGATRTLLTLGTPFRGSAGVAALLLGRTRGSRAAGHHQQVARTMPGVYDMLPVTRTVDHGLDMIRLTAQDLGAVGADAELAVEAFASRETARHMRHGLAVLPPRRGVVGIGQPTVQSLRMDHGTLVPEYYGPRADSGGHLLRGPDGQVLRFDRSGDGLVDRDSASFGSPVDQCFVTGRHGSLHIHPAALHYVRAVLTGRALAPASSSDMGSMVPTTSEAGRSGGRSLPAGAVDPGIGLTVGGSNGVGLRIPASVTVGSLWRLGITGVTSLADVSCTVTDIATDRVVLAPRLFHDGDELSGRVTLASSGLYRIAVAQRGTAPVSDVVLAGSGPDGEE
ncbi:AAA family ATPase [Streptomyces sp. NPDC059447]|uniref:AAA family ATPase n=1 Tax=Streptomyces sp. NPDC059447 TaxID=3346834 RepID=UPI00368B4216